MVAVVANVAARYPQAWQRAHTDHPQTEDFIRLLAWELHSKHDARWGLNGKRGNPADLSDDVVAWRGDGTAVDAVQGGPMEIIDVIAGAGGPNPQPAWIVAPGGPGDRGAWVQPAPPDVPPTVTPQPPASACRYDAGALAKLTQDVNELRNKIAHLAEAVDAIHRLDARLNEEWAARVWAGADVTPVTVEVAECPPYEGRVFGQRITLRPVQP